MKQEILLLLPEVHVIERHVNRHITKLFFPTNAPCHAALGCTLWLFSKWDAICKARASCDGTTPRNRCRVADIQRLQIRFTCPRVRIAERRIATVWPVLVCILDRSEAAFARICWNLVTYAHTRVALMTVHSEFECCWFETYAVEDNSSPTARRATPLSSQA